MTITRYSMFATILWSSLFCIICFFCRRSLFFIQYLGIRSLVILFACCLFRLLFPVELATVIVINSPSILNPIHDFFYAPIQGDLTTMSICIYIWIIVAFVLLLRFAIVYCQYAKNLSKMRYIATEQVYTIAKEVIGDTSKIKITLSHMVSVPMVSGFHNATIVLPDITYSDQELHLIIEHEYAHFKNGDAYIRMLITVFCAIFWWNPVVYLLKYDLDNILEIKCDRSVIKSKKKAEIITYGEILLQFATVGIHNGAPFVTSEFSSDKAIKQRFNLLFQPSISIKRQRILIFFVTSFLILAWLCSYLFSFQSQYNTPQNIESAEAVSISEKANADGTYTIAFEDGSFFYVSEETKQRMLTQKVIHK